MIFRIIQFFFRSVHPFDRSRNAVGVVFSVIFTGLIFILFLIPMKQPMSTILRALILQKKSLFFFEYITATDTVNNKRQNLHSQKVQMILFRRLFLKQSPAYF